MLGIWGDVVFGFAAGLGILAWAFIFGFDMINNTPPGNEMQQQVPEEPVQYPFKKAA